MGPFILHTFHHDPLLECHVATVQDMSQTVQVDIVTEVIDITAFTSTDSPTLPLPPLVNLDAISRGKSSPPLSAPWSRGEGTLDGHDVLFLLKALDLRKRRAFGQKELLGPFPDCIAVRERHTWELIRTILNLQPQVRARDREIDFPRAWETVDRSENLFLPKLIGNGGQHRLIDDLQPALLKTGCERSSAVLFRTRTGKRVVTPRRPVSQSGRLECQAKVKDMKQ